MTDKERILMSILDRLNLTQTLCLHGDREEQFKEADGYEYVHFGGYDDREVQKGDLVICQTTHLHDWKIGWVHEVVGQDCVIREIGSDRLCSVYNERFRRIVGMADMLLLEGDEYLFLQKVYKAFHKGGEWGYRFGDIEFPEPKTARIWIREVFGGIGKRTKPFSFDMKWNKRTSVKKILEAMRENGYGTRKFEPKE